MSFGWCCSYYCGALAFVGIFFFAILIALDRTNSEYLQRNFYKDGEERLTSLIAVVIMNVLIVVGCKIMIDKQSDSHE